MPELTADFLDGSLEAAECERQTPSFPPARPAAWNRCARYTTGVRSGPRRDRLRAGVRKVAAALEQVRAVDRLAGGGSGAFSKR